MTTAQLTGISRLCFWDNFVQALYSKAQKRKKKTSLVIETLHQTILCFNMSKVYNTSNCSKNPDWKTPGQALSFTIRANLNSKNK